MVIHPLAPTGSAADERPAFLAEHFEMLKGVVAGFSLMTYDYSVERVDPTALPPWTPRPWASLVARP